MRYFLFLLFLLPYAAERRVALPDDSDKLTVTVFAKTEAEAKAFLASNPEIAAYKNNSHVNIYTASNPLTKARFRDVPMPSAYVQNPDGTVVTSTSSRPLWRNDKEGKGKEKEKEKDYELDEEDEEETSTPWHHHPLFAIVLAAGLGLAVGFASKLLESKQ